MPCEIRMRNKLARRPSDALFDRDYPLISGINLFSAPAVMIINLLFDVLYVLYGLPRPTRPVRVAGPEGAEWVM